MKTIEYTSSSGRFCQSAHQIPESILNIFCCPDIIFLDQICDDILQLTAFLQTFFRWVERTVFHCEKCILILRFTTDLHKHQLLQFLLLKKRKLQMEANHSPELHLHMCFLYRQFFPLYLYRLL